MAGRVLQRIPGGGLAHNYEGVYALGLALLAFGLADVTWGNGLIAAFVAGVALAVAEHDIPDAFSVFNENVGAIFQAITFFLFGALIVDTPWDKGALVLLAFIAFTLLIARPVAVLLALAGTRLPQPHKLFIAWFGPKGVASMLFALLVLNSAVPHHELVFETASFVIIASIVAHGLTDTYGTRWLERRSG
jgi:NhaP-type Na+/H+ or K+/H+ antiporter